MSTIQVLVFLFSLSSATAFYIDSAILGKYAVPILMHLGATATYKYGKLIAFLQNKPRTSKVIHVVPEPTPYGNKNQVLISESKPYHWDYLNAPLPHKPLFPENLKNPTAPTKYHLPLAPPYLPLNLLYGSGHKFSSPYW